MTVIETCSVGAIVCVSFKDTGYKLKSPRTQRSELTRGSTLLPRVDRGHHRLHHTTKHKSPLSFRFGKFASHHVGVSLEF